MKTLTFVYGPESHLRIATNDGEPGHRPVFFATGGDAVQLPSGTGVYSFRFEHGVAREWTRGDERYYARVMSDDYAVDLERIDEEISELRAKLARKENERLDLLADSLKFARLIRKEDVR